MLRIVKLLWIVVLAFACLWAFANSIVVVNTFVKSRAASGYRAASFVVTSVEYHPSKYVHQAGRRTWIPARWWANGTINGTPERYSLPGELRREPQNQKDLERMVPPGRRFRVRYNPELTSTLVQGESLRVLAYAEDPGKATPIYRRYFLYCVLPVLVLLLPCVLVWFSKGRRWKVRTR